MWDRISETLDFQEMQKTSIVVSDCLGYRSVGSGWTERCDETVIVEALSMMMTKVEVDDKS